MRSSTHKQTLEILAICTIVCLVILPLNFNTGAYFARIEWNDFGWLLLPVLLTFILYLRGRENMQVNHIIVHAAYVLTAIIVIKTLLHDLSYTATIEALRMITFIWFIPLGLYLVRLFSPLGLSLILIGLLTLHSQWAIAQFALQQSLGFSLLGEARASIAEPGVAKFAFLDSKLVRAYGPYQHSNILAGSMLIGLILAVHTAYLYRKQKHIALYTFYTGFFLFTALLLAFSRSAYAGLALYVVTFIITHRLFKQRSESGLARTQSNLDVANTDEMNSGSGAGMTDKIHTLRKLLVPYAITLLVFTPLLFARSTDTADQAFAERDRGYEWFKQIISPHILLWGTGSGKYKDAVQSFLVRTNVSHEEWEIAPVHSTPLLAVAELGLILAGFIIWYFIYSLGLHKTSHAVVALVGLLPSVLLDHYFITSTLPALLAILMFLILRRHRPQQPD